MSRIFYDAWNLFCFQVEKQLRLAYKAAEGNYKRSQSTQHQNAVNETIYREWLLTDDSTVQSLENGRLSDWYRIGTDTGCILSNRIGYCCIGRRYTRINAGSSTVDGIAYTHDDQRAFKRPVTRPPRTHACVLFYGPWYGRGSSSSSSFSLLRTDKTQLAIQTRLQSNSSQYMSLYSNRVIKFLSMRCPICSGSCLSWTRCLSW